MQQNLCRPHNPKQRRWGGLKVVGNRACVIGEEALGKVMEHLYVGNVHRATKFDC